MPISEALKPEPFRSQLGDWSRSHLGAGSEPAPRHWSRIGFGLGAGSEPAGSRLRDISWSRLGDIEAGAGSRPARGRLGSGPEPARSRIRDIGTGPARNRFRAGSEISEPGPARSWVGAGLETTKSEPVRSRLIAGYEAQKLQPSRSRLGDIGAGAGLEPAPRH